MSKNAFARTLPAVFNQLKEAAGWMNLVPPDYDWRLDIDTSIGGDYAVDECARIHRGTWECYFEHGSDSGDVCTLFVLQGKRGDRLEISLYISADDRVAPCNPESDDGAWVFKRSRSKAIETVLKSVAPELLPFENGRFASGGKKPHELVTNIMVRLLTWLETLPPSEQ